MAKVLPALSFNYSDCILINYIIWKNWLCKTMYKTVTYKIDSGAGSLFYPGDICETVLNAFPSVWHHEKCNTCVGFYLY